MGTEVFFGDWDGIEFVDKVWDLCSGFSFGFFRIFCKSGEVRELFLVFRGSRGSFD